MPFTAYIIEKLTELGCIEIKPNPGRDYVSCNCPKGHDVATPSFSVRKTDLVFNCLGCGFKGSSYNFIVNLCGGSREEWRKTAWEQTQHEYFHDFNKTKNKKSTISETEKYVDHSKVAEWLTVNHPYMVESRGFEPGFLKKYNVGFSYEDMAVMFVVYDEKRNLRGVVKRSVTGGSYYFYGFDTGEFLYLCNFQYDVSKPAILVEGCIDALRLKAMGFPNVFACWRSSGFRDGHLPFIRQFPEVIIMFDWDKAGVAGTEKIIKYLMSNMKVSVAMDYPSRLEKGDPGNLIRAEAIGMIKNRHDAFFWSPPKFSVDENLPAC